MPGRSKWLDPARIAHGLKWRSQAFWPDCRPPEATDPPTPTTKTLRDGRSVLLRRDDIRQLDATRQDVGGIHTQLRRTGLAGSRTAGRPERLPRATGFWMSAAAYGGFLVAAGHAGAKELVGIDIDPETARSRQTARHPIIEMRPTLRIADITDPEAARNGWDASTSSSATTCSSMSRTLTAPPAICARFLKPGGRLFLEIPNGLAINYIESDGHYKLPGITLLDHTDAETWFRSFYEDQYPYNTFFYAPLDYYLALFSRNGMPLRLLNTPSRRSEQRSRPWQNSWAATLAAGSKASDDEFPDKPSDLIAGDTEPFTGSGRQVPTPSNHCHRVSDHRGAETWPTPSYERPSGSMRFFSKGKDGVG